MQSDKRLSCSTSHNLLAKQIPANGEYTKLQPTTNITSDGDSSSCGSYASVVKGMPSYSNDVLLKKLDNILVKVEEESSATHLSLEELKEEMKDRYKQTKQQVEVLDNQVKTMEKNFEDLTIR
ncbi:unnamed protein product, partial [Rotaria sp. Silwood2]